MPFTFDRLTKIILSSISKEPKESISNDVETSVIIDIEPRCVSPAMRRAPSTPSLRRNIVPHEDNDDDWQHINNTPFTEPFWGVVVNK